MGPVLSSFVEELTKAAGIGTMLKGLGENIMDLRKNPEVRSALARSAALGAGTAALDTALQPKQNRHWKKNLLAGGLAGGLTGLTFPGWFAHGAMKTGSVNPTGPEVVMAESMGPIPSAVRGFLHGRKGGGSVGRGLLEALKHGGAYVGGGGLGALAGYGLARLAKRLVGKDLGAGPLTLGTILPALGGVVGGLKAEKLLHHA